eukprot:1988-Eustigmatos_ZCMA.PRE.1
MLLCMRSISRAPTEQQVMFEQHRRGIASRPTVYACVLVRPMCPVVNRKNQNDTPVSLETPHAEPAITVASLRNRSGLTSRYDTRPGKRRRHHETI